jgi:hypothetical protein
MALMIFRVLGPRFSRTDRQAVAHPAWAAEFMG